MNNLYKMTVLTSFICLQVIGCSEDNPQSEDSSGLPSLQFVPLEENDHKTIQDLDMFHQTAHLYPESKIVS